MITILDSAATASAHWAGLVKELDRWGEQGRIATLWWRDDDAVASSRRLCEQLSLGDGIPVALAVIPAIAEPAFAEWLADRAPMGTYILQHGWRHANHAEGGKKSEFPQTRAAGATALDLGRGRARLTALFGTRALPVLAPPWNRFDECRLPLLPEADIGAISQIKPRQAAFVAPGVFAANVHVDLVAWRGDRGFIGEAMALGGLVGHLHARRTGAADCDEPTGILTHHLIQDKATSTFLDRLLQLTRGHPAARWLDAGEVFMPACANRPTARLA